MAVFCNLKLTSRSFWFNVSSGCEPGGFFFLSGRVKTEVNGVDLDFLLPVEANLEEEVWLVWADGWLSN